MESRSTTRWWNGLPLSHQRELSQGEVRQLETLAISASRRRMFWLLAPTALLVLFIFALSFFPGVAWVSVGVIGWTFVVLPLCVLLAGHYARRARLLWQDLMTGLVDVFCPESEISPDLNSDKRGALAPEQLMGLTSIDVLNRSGRVLRVNGVNADSDLWYGVAASAVRAEVASMPRSAEAAAEWVEPFHSQSCPGLHRNFRQLSATEKAEILKFGRKTLWNSVPLAILFIAWALVPVVAWLTDEKVEIGVWPAIQYIGVPIVAVMRVWIAAQDLVLVWRMRADVRRGEVVILRVEQDGDQSLSQPEERLPISWVPWTRNSRPVRWRLISS